MKEKYEELTKAEQAIEGRKRVAAEAIADAERVEHEADAALEKALAEGGDVDRIRKVRAGARQRADDAREAVAMIEAGRVAALEPYAQAVLDDAPATIGKIQAGYNAAVSNAKAAYFAYMDALAVPRSIERDAGWIREAVTLARSVTGSKLFMGLTTVDVDRKDSQGWRV